MYLFCLPGAGCLSVLGRLTESLEKQAWRIVMAGVDRYGKVVKLKEFEREE